ncbi:50S ribosomal protein L23 [Candidatus Margulisiibacteriota bacterium]
MDVIIEKPLISEKTAKFIQDGKYVFYIDTRANKIEVKKFVEEFFKVKVKSVNICNVKGKRRKKRRNIGVTKNRKKAIVTLEKSSEIKKVKELF